MTPTAPQGHLPLLYNVYLNCIFNNPHHDKSPFKQTIHDLAANHTHYTILVPPSYILNDAYDPATATNSTKLFLKDLCYTSEDFIRSHIIQSSAPTFTGSNSAKNQLIIFYTLNGKQILVKNGQVFTGKGFKRSLRLKILGYGTINAFCDYFPRGSKFMLMYIEDSLVGSNFLKMNEYVSPAFLDSFQDPKPLQKDVAKKTELTFDMILRYIPSLSTVVSEKYYKLFHHNNKDYETLKTMTRKQLSFVKKEFYRMIDQAYSIVLDSINEDTPEARTAFNLIQNLLGKDPDIDLNQLVYEYVELNQYDKIWSQLIYQFNYPNDDKTVYDPEAIKYLTPQKYNSLSCLSLNHLEVPVDEPWLVNSILKRVSVAIDVFSRLSDSSITSLAGKREVITETINILTSSPEVSGTLDEKSNDQLVVDADTLMGMLIMVVIHSKVPNLEAHIYYIKNFSTTDPEDGYFNYILSNLEAVIYHISVDNDDGHLQDLVDGSQSNYVFWSAIQKQDNHKIRNLIGETKSEFENRQLPAKHYLRSRNINGESCLMFAIKSKSPQIFNLLIESDDHWFLVEDLLFDRNTTTGQNLLTVSLVEEATEISLKLVNIILDCTSIEEQLAYFNLPDDMGRTVGHHIFHNLDVLSAIGHLINWELKDLNGHSPLFSICRCYDHPNYIELISRVFSCIYDKNPGKGIDFEMHLDKNGNTLLHVILKGLKESRILDSLMNMINLNQTNHKSVTPLTFYVKYSRVSNLEELLKDKRLNFQQEEPKSMYTVFDYLSFLASKPTAQGEDFQQIESLVYGLVFEKLVPSKGVLKLFATNAKYDPKSKEWAIFIRVKETDDNQYTFFEPLSKINQMIQLFSMSNPFIVIPSKESFWMNFKADGQTIQGYSKFNINRLLDKLNVFFASICLYSPDACELFLLGSSHNQLKKKLAFDIIKEVSKGKRSLGDVTLTGSQVYESEMFLNYSYEDLDNYRKTLVKFNKLMSVYEVKLTDERVVGDRFICRFLSSGLIPKFKESAKFTLKGDENSLSSYSQLLDFTIWLELSIGELLTNISKVVERISAWKEIYSKIKSINNELKKYETKASIHIHEVDTNDEQLNQAQEIDIPVSPSTTNTTDENRSFFSFGLENKKSRYRRLLLAKADEVKKIMNLNGEIKLEHEAIASETSKFLKYKSEFLLYAMKRFTDNHLVSLRQRLYELETLQLSLKN